MATTFYPSRWRVPLFVVGLSFLLLGLSTLLFFRQWTGIAPVFSSFPFLWQSRRLGVYVSEHGVERKSFIGNIGLWTWDSIESVGVQEQEFVKGRVDVVLRRSEGPLISLGPAKPRQERLVEDIRSHLSR